jgi:hypothetical protein
LIWQSKKASRFWSQQIRNLKYQQNLKVRRIAIVVLASTSWPRIQRALVAVVRAINAATDYTEVEIPCGDGQPGVSSS